MTEWLKKNKMTAIACGSAVIVVGGLVYAYTTSQEEPSDLDLKTAAVAEDVKKVKGETKTAAPTSPTQEDVTASAKVPDTEEPLVQKAEATIPDQKEDSPDATMGTTTAPVDPAVIRPSPSVGTEGEGEKLEKKGSPSKAGSRLKKALNVVKAISRTKLLAVITEMKDESISSLISAITELQQKHNASSMDELKTMMRSQPSVAQEFQMTLMGSQKAVSEQVLGKYGLTPEKLNEAVLSNKDDPQFVAAINQNNQQTHRRLAELGFI